MKITTIAYASGVCYSTNKTIRECSLEERYQHRTEKEIATEHLLHNANVGGKTGSVTHFDHSFLYGASEELTPATVLNARALLPNEVDDVGGENRIVTSSS